MQQFLTLLFIFSIIITFKKGYVKKGVNQKNVVQIVALLSLTQQLFILMQQANARLDY